ncbi:Ribose-phosphate pyrophosphokinase [Methanimicrococcus sp. At1]|uniref:Ribose-phosphate pyrophosphokinase n=1 Tax=Methanimicrococcus hacksteinii TaxID=3028293 RepID=A0ABU3VNC1_9EURY|nr:ribose-phosphate diphosphokinase [Methanimicrococcus sp. At1]MDV0444893.1 Ribose-phosphate pyrophosphokinase [Methanimicrococcus sp. At1]
MKIIGGPSSQALACRVAAELNIKPTITDFIRFPDNEQYVQIKEDVAGADVVLIQSTTTDSDLVALLQLLDACESAKAITVVIPYMGYARQDKKFKDGEAISARAMARAVTASNLKKIYTINLHEKSISNYFTCPAEDLDASKLIAGYVDGLGLERPLLIAPDKGVRDMVENMADGLSLDWDVFDKTRLAGDQVVMADKQMDIAGRDVIIVDDMIATGGTMAEAVSILEKNGARDVYVACIHPVLTRNAVLRLSNAGVKDIIGTDTIEKVQSRISTAPIIADALKK